MNEPCEKIYKNISDLYNSVDFKKYKEFMNTLASIISQIEQRDKINKLFIFVQLIPTKNEIEQIINIIVSLNGKISETNAKMNPECSKCKSAVMKYEYCIREVERMRDELKEQNEIDEQFINTPDEEKSDFKAFMNRNYPSIDKFQLNVTLKRSIRKSLNKIKFMLN